MRKDIQVKIKKILAVGLASFMAFTSVPYMSAANNVYASDLTDSGTVNNPANIDETTKFTGCSVDLEDNIHLKFYFEMPEALYGNYKSNTSSKVVFALGEETVEVALSGTTKVSSKEEKSITIGTYSVTCPVPAKQMADVITANLKVSGVDYASATYSVKEYGEYIINHPDDYDESAVATVKAMLNYGGYSQVYFGYNTANLANANCKKTDFASTLSAVNQGGVYTTYEKDDYFAYSFGTNFQAKYIRYIITDSISYEILFYNGIDALKNHTITFKDANGKNSYATENVTMNGTQYIKVAIPKLHARNLFDNITVSVYDNGSYAGNFTLSPRNYVYQAMASVNFDQSNPLVIFMAALYDYYSASKDYYDQNTVQSATGLTYGDFVYDRQVFGGQPSIIVTGYTGSGSTVNIPSTIEGYPVYAIGDGTHSIFNGNANTSNITQIIIPNGVTNIKKLAFAYFKEPVDVTVNTNYWDSDYSKPNYPYVQGFGGNCTANIPNSLQSVGNGAFTGIRVSQNSWNTTVTADVDGNVYQGTVLKSASDYSKVVGRLRINSNVTEIAPYAVYGCLNYNYVVLPEALTTIGEYAFYRCDNLRGTYSGTASDYIMINSTGYDVLKIPASCSFADRFAFFGCTSINLIQLMIVPAGSQNSNTSNDTYFLYKKYTFGKYMAFSLDRVFDNLSGTNDTRLRIFNAAGAEISDSFGDLMNSGNCD